MPERQVTRVTDKGRISLLLMDALGCSLDEAGKAYEAIAARYAFTPYPVEPTPAPEG